MIFDLAYAVRKVLAEKQQKPARLCGILTFSTPRQPDERKLALANAHAALRELRYYSSHYPGEPSCGLEPSTAAGGPFEEVYCVDWGEDLDVDRFGQAQQQLADYLFANTLAPQRTFFEACRAEPALPVSSSRPFTSALTANSLQKEPAIALADPPESVSCPAGDYKIPSVKTLGLRRLAFSRKDIPPSWVDFLCRKVVDHWQGIAKNNALCGTARLPNETPGSVLFRQLPHQLTPGKITSPNAPGDKLYLDDLLNQGFARLGSKLGELDETEFCKMLQKSCCESALRQAEAVHLTSRQVCQAVDSFLGPARTLDQWKDSPECSLQKSLLEVLHVMARDEIPGLVNNILQANGSLPSGCAAVQAKVENYLAEIRQEDDQNHRSQEHLREVIAQSEQILSTQTAILAASKKSWWPFKSHAKIKLALAPCWLEYAQRRRNLIVLQAMSFMLQALKSDLCVLGDKLRDLQHELHKLGENFPVEDLPSGDEDNVALDSAAAEGWSDVKEQLRMKAPELIRRCVDCCRSMSIMESKTSSSNEEEAFRLVDTADKQLRSAVGEVLLAFLRPQMFQVWVRQAAAGSGITWQEIFASAKPLLNDCGGAQRILLSAPALLLDRLKQTCQAATEIKPTVLASTEEQILVCCELDRLSLPRVAAHCLKDQLDLTSLARRLHARIDVNWSSPPCNDSLTEAK